MGERKGINKYYPPDYDPKRGGLNKFVGTHALRERARKIHLGIIIVRFEMPFNIWCQGCKNHIGMGVRYNAEKQKIGMYYSTQIYQFRMKCHLCDNHFEIKTNPQNFEYVIVSGARRQDNRWNPEENEQIIPKTKEVQKKLFDDPMFKLEHILKDNQSTNKMKPALKSLYRRNSNVWKDSYEANCKLRHEFRIKRKELQKQREEDQELLARSSLNIKLLPKNDDHEFSKLTKLQSKSAEEKENKKLLNVLMKPVLPSVTEIGGFKRQKLLKTKLKYQDLGIRRKNSNANRKSNIDNKTDSKLATGE